MRKTRNTRPLLCGIFIAAAGAALLSIPQRAYASSGNKNEEYVTISVDAMDGNGKITYALDTDDPAAFTESNEFAVPAGTTHTIYVKDEAGNITSQEYPGQMEPLPGNTDTPDSETKDMEGGRGDYHIDIELDRTPPGITADAEPAEPGAGTVYGKTTTDSSADAEKVFYTVTTDEGDVFYLVIDQGQTSNNVYFLDQVKLSDLKALSVDDTQPAEEEEKSSSLLDALSSADSAEKEMPQEDETAEQPPSKNNGSTLIILILAAAGGAVYYYMKVYKNKKDMQMDLADAMEREDFSADCPEEDDGIDFELEEGYQEEALSRLFEEEEESTELEEYEKPEGEIPEEPEGLGEDIPEGDFFEPEDFEFDFEEDEEEEELI